MNRKRFFIIVAAVITVAAMMTIFVSCNKLDDMFGAPDNVKYDGSYISWDAVTEAKYYNVTINGGDTQRATSTTYAYKSNEAFDVTVSAVFEKGEKSTSVNFKPLSSISTIQIGDSGEISWDAVSGATGYVISVNGTENTVTDTFYNQLVSGTNRIKIKPIVVGDSTYYSAWTEEKKVNICAVPTNLKFEGGLITWGGSASNYLLEIEADGSARRIEEVFGNSFQYDTNAANVTISVKALGDHTVTFDSPAISDDYHFLGSVSEMRINNGILTWDAVPGAKGYKVKIDKEIKTVVTPEYKDLAANVSVDVSVLPYNDEGNYYSSWSIEKSIFILPTPEVRWNPNLALDGEIRNNTEWNSVEGADGYTVRITYNGKIEEKNEGPNMNSHGEAFVESGVYTIEVKATASAGSNNKYDSKYSAPITVERLVAPNKQPTDSIISNKDSIAEGVTFNFQKVPNASRYQLYRDGVLLEGKVTTGGTLVDNTVAGYSASGETISYSVRSMGDIKSVNGKVSVTLASLEGAEFEMTVQPVPQEVDMDGFSVKWISSAVHGFCIDHDGIVNTATGSSYDLSSVFEAGSHSVKVCARGNGSNVLASNYSAPLNVSRLETPADVKITSEGNGKLSHTLINNATGYSVFLDANEESLDEANFSNMYQYITTTGTTVTIRADRNEWNNERTLYYMSSKKSSAYSFMRLTAPTFEAGALSTATALAWEAPSNFGGGYTISYKLEINGSQTTSATTDRQLSLVDRAAGKYEIKVIAIGNETKYLNSEYSESITFTKMASPEIRKENGKYVWDKIVGAVSYYVEIDGVKKADVMQTSESTYHYTPSFKEATTHSVKIKAVGNNAKNGYVNSEWFSIIQETKVLTTPKISYEYSADQVTVDGRIIVTIDTPVADCTGYDYSIGGVVEFDTAISHSKIINHEGSYAITVRAKGGSFDTNGVYCLDSALSGSSMTDKIILLGAPNISGFALTEDGGFSWSTVSNSHGYDYQISYSGETPTGLVHVGTPSLSKEIANHTTYASIKIMIRATGSVDGKTVSSEWVEYIWTNPNPVG